MRPYRIILTIAAISVFLTLILTGVFTLNPLGSTSEEPLTPHNDAGVGDLLNRLANNPRDGNALLQLGLIHEENGHFMAALETLRLARAAGIAERTLSSAMGRCLARLERPEDAVVELERAAGEGPADARTAIDLAFVRAKLGSRADAIRRLRRFAESSGLSKAGTGGAAEVASLATAFDALKDEESALAWAEHATRLAPNVPDGYLIAGRILLKRGRFVDSAELIARAVQLRPESARIREMHGDSLAGLDRGGSGALERWLEAIELRSTRFATYTRAAELLKERGELVRSAETLTRAGLNTQKKANSFALAAAAWEGAGDSNQALYCRATGAAAGGAYSKALVLYKRLSESPEDQWRKSGLDGMAEMYRLMNRPHEYLSAAQKAGDDLRIANAYLLLRDPIRRDESLRRAIKKDPAVAGVAYLELAASAEATKNIASAIKLYVEALAADPANLSALLALSRLYSRASGSMDQRTLAVEYAAKAAAIAPGAYTAFKQLGRACSLAGSPQRAKQAFQHAIDLNPRDADSYRLLAVELRALGEVDAASESASLATRFERFRTPGRGK